MWLDLSDEDGYDSWAFATSLDWNKLTVVKFTHDLLKLERVVPTSERIPVAGGSDFWETKEVGRNG